MMNRIICINCAFHQYNKNIVKTMFDIVEPNQAQLKIIDKQVYNHDCYIYSLKFIGGVSFKMSIGEHLKIHMQVKTIDHPQGEQVVRKYTPISRCNQEIIKLLIKIYRPCKNYPYGGKLTQYLQKLQIEDIINISGPYGKFNYIQENNTIIINNKQIQKKKKIFFIAGGTGITPIYQVIRQILLISNCKIEIILLFANKTLKDILLQKQLNELSQTITIKYILDQAAQEQNWNGYIGWINKQILENICSLNQEETFYCFCGPTPMNKIIRGIFKQYYPNSILFKF